MTIQNCVEIHGIHDIKSATVSNESLYYSNAGLENMAVTRGNFLDS